ncbi:Alw26I/Eco31I/Esp3I family type II restriction endonuclease [Candidatus Woesearchaeota archaeon]|nr:Alw26I/Eco31I/Esp3I family type II restriction endonuclease [Candidatus Woesearchaeota archaeon]
MVGIKYGDQRRKWNPAFVKYMKYIVGHKNYEGMPAAIDDEKQIRWNAPSNRPPGSKWSDLHDLRLKWWRKKAAEIHIPLAGHWISKTAKRIHPVGKKPCQTCGRVMILSYIYPTKSTITKLNRHLQDDKKIAHHDFLTIHEVIDVLESEELNAIGILREVFPKIPADMTSTSKLKTFFNEKIIPSEPQGKLSPGAMSNAPDRLDGFHTYNLCCRSGQDTGRDSENLKTYIDDRRAFEQWCQGNWAAANILMKLSGRGTCAACGKDKNITADHVGPISLGFAHTPFFEPLCRSCNSSKNNRMNLADVLLLIKLEKRGVRVISIHAKYLWDSCKNQVDSDAKARLLSKLLRINQHHYLTLLKHVLDDKLPDTILQFLSPQFAKNKYSFEGLNKQTFKFKRMMASPRSPTYAQSKAARMMRIAFEALEHYGAKDRRNVQFVEQKKLARAEAMMKKELEKAKAQKDLLREKLNVALSEKDSKKRADVLESIFKKQSHSNNDYSYVRRAILLYLVLVGRVLKKRFDENRAIRIGD